MREALVRVMDDKNEYPRDVSQSDSVPKEVVKNWLGILEEWGFTSVVLVGEDCFRHGDIEEIHDYASRKFRSVSVMTRGQYLSVDQVKGYQQEMHREGVERDLIVPVDWYNPFEGGDVLGRRGYELFSSGIKQYMMSSLESQIWMTVTGENARQAMQYLQQLPFEIELFDVAGSSWAQSEVSPAPDDFVESLPDELKPGGWSRWLWLHHQVNQIESAPRRYQQAVMDKSFDFVGSLYVTTDGMVRAHPMVSDEEMMITRMEREDLQVFADGFVETEQKLAEKQKQQQQQHIPDSL